MPTCLTIYVSFICLLLPITSLLSMSFLESTIFITRVLSLLSNQTISLLGFVLFFFLISKDVIFLILLSMVASNNHSQKSGRCDTLC